MDIEKKVTVSDKPANTAPTVIQNHYHFKAPAKIILVLGLTFAGCWMTITNHGGVASDLFIAAMLAFLLG